MSGLIVAQTNAPGTTSDPSNVADELKQLREQMAQQQKQLTDQQKELEKLRKQVGSDAQTASAANSDSASGDSRNAHLVNTGLTAPASANGAVAKTVSTGNLQETERKESPLSFRIGGAEFTPGGFLQFTSIFRTTNTGNPGGTNFFAIPFNNLVAGHLTENRFTAANSRIILKVTEKFGKNDVAGYVEADFLGNDAANVEVTSNPHTFRQRLYFVDVKRDKFEVQAGQMWGWLTPTRVGLSPYPSDIFNTLDVDYNYQVGLPWTRQPGVRFIYHPNDHWAMGLGLENPEQFGGQGEITFPATFNQALGVQIDSANSAGTPNVHPDILPKIAYDTDRNGKHFHAEVTGLVSGFKVTNTPVGQTGFATHNKEGFGGEAAINYEAVKNFHIVANAFWSAGGGRYLFGAGPDLVVLPTPAGNDVFISPVHASSGIFGFEYQATPKTMLYSYYGGEYFGRNFARDTTPAAKPNTFVGFGGPGSANSNNRSIQEATVGFIQTFWKSPQHGALLFSTQVSYLTRSPWALANSLQPKNAHLVEVLPDLRFILP